MMDIKTVTIERFGNQLIGQLFLQSYLICFLSMSWWSCFKVYHHYLKAQNLYNSVFNSFNCCIIWEFNGNRCWECYPRTHYTTFRTNFVLLVCLFEIHHSELCLVVWEGQQFHSPPTEGVCEVGKRRDEAWVDPDSGQFNPAQRHMCTAANRQARMGHKIISQREHQS